MNVLLVEPNFPYPSKSKNKANHVHKNFVPVSLLKFASLYKDQGHKVALIRGRKSREDLEARPDKILITSIFTYWSSFVWDVASHYRGLFPKAEIILGGIYATLHAESGKLKNLSKQHNIKIFKGLHPMAERYLPDYSLLPAVEYHATHMMRGCIRKCAFCGTWKIEPKRINKTKDEVINELIAIKKNKIIFYDNNILANPHIKEILKALPSLKINKKPVLFESQSGFDGRLLERDKDLAELIKKARFSNVRIAWDNGLNDRYSIQRQLDLLVKAGYQAKDISIFMIYNFEICYEDMLKKIDHCKKWGVQITDCRYRPLDVDYDNYKPYMTNGQLEGEYYIHKGSGWTDLAVRDFRRRVREHNIWIRYAKDKGLEYDKKMEKWSSINNTYKFFNLSKAPYIGQIEKSKYLQKKIMMLNKLKNYYKAKNIEPPDLGSCSAKKHKALFYELVGSK